MTHRRDQDTPAGVAYGFTAYALWGFMPLYFVAMKPVPSLEILAHRIVFSTVFLLSFLAILGRFTDIIRCFKNKRLHRALAMSAALVGANWLIYILAVNGGNVVETALGYFINPLFNVLLGAIIFRERLRRAQSIAILIAAAGVMYMVVKVGDVPWVALALAGTFAVYGAIRKVTPVDGTLGLAVESLMLLPFAGSYVIYLISHNHLEFAQHGPSKMWLVICSGVVLTVPMIFFGQGATRLRLTTQGFLQYIAPTLQFILAIRVFGEPLNWDKLVGFIFVWAALALYTIDTIRVLHANRRKRLIDEPILSPT